MPRVELQEKNHIVRWGCLLCLVFFGIFTVCITLIDDRLTHHPHLVNGTNFEAVLHVITFFLSLVLLRFAVLLKARQLNREYLERFQRVSPLGTFEESRGLIHFPGQKPYKHAVLLLHGFTASTQEFAFLSEKLRAEGIPYISPMIPGFGTDDARVLWNVSRKDWLRTALESYTVLESVADEVSVVGHSLGGMLSVALTQFRRPKHLILSAPGLYPTASDRKYKRILTDSIFSDLYIALIPYLPKPIRPGRVSPSDTLDAEYCRKVFQFLAVPIRSVKQLFLLQNETDIAKVNCETLSIVYGTHDLTVDMGEVFNALDTAKVPYEKYEFTDSAHNVLEDNERENACNTVVSIIKTP